MSAPTQRYGVVQAFRHDAEGLEVNLALRSALDKWLREAPDVPLQKIERVDPPVFRGQPLGFSYFDEETREVVETPPMSAWRLEGIA